MYPVSKREQTHGAEVLAQELMPNHFEAALPAGSAIAFDSSIWHTTFANVSGQDRRAAHFTYRSSAAASQSGQHGLSESTLGRLAAEGKLGVQRRRILGLPDEGLC